MLAACSTAQVRASAYLIGTLSVSDADDGIYKGWINLISAVQVRLIAARVSTSDCLGIRPPGGGGLTSLLRRDIS